MFRRFDQNHSGEIRTSRFRPFQETHVFRILVATLGLAGSLLAATPKFAFPYMADYPYGIRVTNAAPADVQTHFDAWKTSYYAACPDSTRARIKWIDPTASGTCDPNTGNCTVSEGIGYGMLITVYMDNASNQTQGMFDKLWAYYQNKADGNGLMNWKANDCDKGTVATGAATDADVDAALALAMANKQWGDAKYLTAAQTLLGKIWDKEVNSSTFLLKPDDQGTANVYNPSYFAVGAARVFASVDASHQWAKVADACLAFIAKNQKSTTGLVSDWADNNGSPLDHNGSGTTKFGYDAVRTPWRVALDYWWFGTAAAKTDLDKIGTWIYGATAGNPLNIRANYNLDGTNDNTRNAVYTGAMLMAGISNPADTAWIRSGLNILLVNKYAGADGDYYNKCWKVVYLLGLSGNFQNFWGTVKPAGIVGQQAGGRGWSATVRTGTVDLSGSGPVRAQLLDLSGRVLSQASGVGSARLARPAGRGVWLVRILGERPLTISVVVD
jgi:endo-1,4-beta-D-glucanase Y